MDWKKKKLQNLIQQKEDDLLVAESDVETAIDRKDWASCIKYEKEVNELKRFIRELKKLDYEIFR